MKKMIFTTVLLAAATAFAQTDATSTNATTSNTQNNAVQGCLSGSSGNFNVADQSGKSWKLAGAQGDLQKNVGHMVQLQGAVDATDSSTYNVTSVKSVADTCSQSSASTSTSTDQSNTSAAAASTSQPASSSDNFYSADKNASATPKTDQTVTSHDSTSDSSTAANAAQPPKKDPLAK